MTDSKTATERLREMLDARGVEWYEPPTKPNKTWFPDENGINCCARPWSDALEIRRHGLTPEQAIAATLGDDDYERKMDALLCYLTNGKFSKSRQYSLDFMKSCVDEEYETAMNDEIAELKAALNKAAGNWAKADRLARDMWEQVSHCPDYPIPPCMTESICEQFRNLPDVEQAATLGSGECEVTYKELIWTCQSCGVSWRQELDYPNFCPNCGRRVKR